MNKSGHVVFIQSNPANVVGLFFTQNFPGGKTSLEAAQACAASLVDASTGQPVAADVRPMEINDYVLQTQQVVTF